MTTVPTTIPVSTNGIPDVHGDVHYRLHVADLFRLSVRQYQEMIETGIIGEDDCVELLEGILVTKMPKNEPHILALGLLKDLLQAILPAGWFINTQDPVASIDSEPEPDLSMIRGTRRDYRSRKPRSEDVCLLVEVADTSLGRDRFKKSIYARAGFAVYWIVNLVDHQIEVYTQPGESTEKPDYENRRVFTQDDDVPIIIDGTEIGRIAVKDVLRRLKKYEYAAAIDPVEQFIGAFPRDVPDWAEEHDKYLGQAQAEKMTEKNGKGS